MSRVGRPPSVLRSRTEGAYQIVLAEKRGDLCYINKRGWYWHEIDADGGINVATVTGPFKSALEARTSFIEAPRHCNGEWIEYP